MKKDFFPDSWRNIRDWCDDFIQNASVQLSGIKGWDGPRISALLLIVAAIRDAAQAILDAEAVMDAKIGIFNDLLPAKLTLLRKDLNNLKTSDGWNDGNGNVLKVNAPPGTINPATLKPPLEVDSKLGRNVIMAKKLGAHSLNIYWRYKGETTWHLLAAKRVRFPLEDQTPTPDGKPAVREYRAIAVIGDDEVGEPSDIVEATFTQQ